MAVKGAGIFDNDDAIEWLDSFESDGPQAIETALTGAADLGKTDYLEATDAAYALAAAEIVAAARDGEIASLPDDFAPRFAEHVDDINDAELVPLARKAVMRVLRSSELKDIAEDSDDEDWEESVRDLLERLKG
jgi:hypothetical protein